LEEIILQTYFLIKFFDTINRNIPSSIPLQGVNIESFKNKLVFLVEIIANTRFNNARHYMLVPPDARIDSAINIYHSVLQSHPDLFKGYKIGENVKTQRIPAQFYN